MRDICQIISLKCLREVQLTKSQRWFRQWLGANQATSRYMNQGWFNSLTHTYNALINSIINTHLYSRVAHIYRHSCICGH